MRCWRKKVETIKLRDAVYPNLARVLKAAGWVEDGVEAKFAVQRQKVSVNGETDTRRGRKLYDPEILSVMTAMNKSCEIDTGTIMYINHWN